MSDKFSNALKWVGYEKEIMSLLEGISHWEIVIA